MSRKPKPPPPGLYRIHAVARATGISAHALRVWERRYGTMASHRSEAGYRLFSDDDVARLRTIKELVDAGHALAEIAPLPSRDLARLGRTLPPGGGPVAEVARGRFLEAILALDGEQAQRVLASAALAMAPDPLMEDVIAPLLRELGDRWHAGTLSVAQEHAASALLRAQLVDLLRQARPGPGAPVIIGTTPEGELHELGALIAPAPAADLAKAARVLGARAVLVSVIAMAPGAAADALAAYRKALPRGCELWVGGAAAPGPRTLDELRAAIGRDLA